MRIYLIFLMGMVGMVGMVGGQIPGEREKAAAALKILDGWHRDGEKREERFLHFVLWTPKGREAPADYEGRLTRIMLDIRDFYGREMERLGFGPRSINLPMTDEGGVKIHLIEGQKVESEYGKSSGNEIRNECVPILRERGIEADRETLVIFCNLAEWDEEKLEFRHKSPYYAGGNHQRGTAWQLDSPELDVVNIAKKEPMIRDGEYGKISLGKHNSIFIGGIAHELGHALGLPHCRERPDEAMRGTALMGSGNRTYGDELRGEGKGSFLTLAHALRLASHPQFSGSVKGMNLPVKAEFTELSLEVKGKGIELRGKLKADPPVYAVVAYFDPEGGSDYDATTATAVPDEEGNFFLSTDALRAGKAGELRLIPLHVNGATAGWLSQTPFQYPYVVAKDGTPDVSGFQMRAALKPVISALSARDRERAVAEARQLPEGKVRRLAENLVLGGSRAQQKPSEYDGDAGSFPMTRFLASEAKVGWRSPTYDALPEAPFLLEAAGEIFETGIYAHAPASHRYELGGKWNRLTGKAALLAGKGGTVVFEILGDGKSLWKSSLIKEGVMASYEVNLNGVKSLELRVDPTADGTGSDWALWLGSELTNRE